MDWFSRLVGFDESIGPDEVRRRLHVEDGALVSDASPRRALVGRAELPSLGDLRRRACRLDGPASTVLNVVGDARALHSDPAHAGALFQAASQFNLLEMVSPDVTPDHGVGRYEQDHTQGPACAMAAGAATIWRNYLIPLEGGIGQTRERQLDALADLGAALAAGTGLSVAQLWDMRNGYALCTPAGLDAIDRHLRRVDEQEHDALRALLRVGLVWGAEVTDPGAGRLVSQAFCSALPVAYSRDPYHRGWPVFARLVLEASYEATLLAARLNPLSRRVLLTRVGGGVFGNDQAWIEAAMRRAVSRVPGVEVLVVNHADVPDWSRRLEADFS